MAPISPISNLPPDSNSSASVPPNTTLLTVDDGDSIQDEPSQHVSTFSTLPVTLIVEQTARILEDIKRKIQLQKEEEEERLKQEREMRSFLPEAVTTTPSSTSTKSFIILNQSKNLSLSPDSGTDYPSASSSISPPYLKSKENAFTVDREIPSTIYNKKGSPMTEEEHNFSFDEEKGFNEISKFSPIEKKFLKSESYLSPIENFSLDVANRKELSTFTDEHKKNSSPTNDFVEKYRKFNFDSPLLREDEIKVERRKSMKDEFPQRHRILSESETSTVVQPVISPIKRKSFILENDYSLPSPTINNLTMNKHKSVDYSSTKPKSFILEDEIFPSFNFEPNTNLKLEKFSPLEREIMAAEQQIHSIEHQREEEEEDNDRFKYSSFTLPLASTNSPTSSISTYRNFSGVNITSPTIPSLAKSTPSISTDLINERPISFTVLPNQLDHTYQSAPPIASPYKSTLSCSSLANFTSSWNPVAATQIPDNIPSTFSSMISQNRHSFGSNPSAIKPIVSALEYPPKTFPSPAFSPYTVTSVTPKSLTNIDKKLTDNIISRNATLERYNKFVEKQKLQMELQQQQQQADFLSLSLSPPMNRRHKLMPILRGSFASL